MKKCELSAGKVKNNFVILIKNGKFALSKGM